MLLINPGIHPDTQPVAFRPFQNTSFPTAIGYLGAYLQKHNGVECALYDEQITPLGKDSLRNLLISNSNGGPRLVGISTLTGTAKRAYEITRWIKEIDSETTVIVGGIHPTAVPDEVLTITPADIVVRGEGEATLSELYSVMLAGDAEFGEIKGISFRHKGEVIHNPERELIDVNDVPFFPYHYFDENRHHYPDFGTIISSRGCPFNCTFCSQRLISGNRMRYLSNERVMNKIKLLVDKYEQTKIFFADDVFTVNMKRTESLCDEIIASGYHEKVSFICESRAREICMNEERGMKLLTKMKEANFSSILYGVETGSERMMSTINKTETVQDNVRAIEMTHEAGIKADASLIMGLPTESKKDRKLSIEVVKRAPLDAARYNIACPYPGTAFYHTAKEEGRLNIGDEWINCSNQHYLSDSDLPYTPQNTTDDELVLAVLLANLRFTLRPAVLIHMLFADSLVGGTVISMKHGWFKSLKMWADIARLAGFLIRRSAVIVFKGAILPHFSGRKIKLNTVTAEDK